MPIYAYRCDACGHAKDVLQKLSDPVLSACPACGADTFRKQVTAAGFQLKGSGWYVTDFKGGANAAKDAQTPASADAKPGDAKPGDAKPADAKPADTKPAAGAATPAPSASSAGAASSGSTPVPAGSGTRSSQ